MEKVLDARDPNQVSSATVLDADLGVDNRHLLVLSGIAISGWEIDSDETALRGLRVRLATYARDLEQASPYVGLASIANDESEFVFAADSARVDLDADTGELSLYMHTALMGQTSSLNRIAYQVVATVVRVGVSISGSITWPTSLMRPASNDPSIVAPHFMVVANHREMTPGDGLWAPMEKLTPIVPGAILSVKVGRTECTATYRIDNPPMALPLKVTATVDPSFAPGHNVVPRRTAGPDIFTLSPFHTSETVDFAVADIAIK